MLFDIDLRAVAEIQQSLNWPVIFRALVPLRFSRVEL